MKAARRNADRDRSRQKKEEDDMKQSDFTRQMRELQEKLRESHKDST